jgi:hypothetical protein
MEMFCALSHSRQYWEIELTWLLVPELVMVYPFPEDMMNDLGWFFRLRFICED